MPLERRIGWCRSDYIVASARITYRDEIHQGRKCRGHRNGPHVRPQRRRSGNTETQQQGPGELDWDMYCGPAPLRPFNRMIHPGGFRNFLDFANGTLGDWGVHWLDQVLWWSEEKYPKKVYSTGGRPVRGPAVLNDREQTTDAPDSQIATYEFESFTAVWEHRRYAGNNAEKHPIGCYFYGTRGLFTWAGGMDGPFIRPMRNKSRSMKTPFFRNRMATVSNCFGRFLECNRNRRQANLRHRNRSSGDQCQSARHVVVEAWKEHYLGWNEGKMRRR